MVNVRAAKVALVVAGLLLLALFAGQVLRRLTWMLSWGMLVAMVMLVAYGVYELKKGWTDAESEDASARDTASYPTQAHTEQSRANDTDADTLENLQQSYVEADLSEEEFEAELEDLMDEDGRDLEREHELR